MNFDPEKVKKLPGYVHPPAKPAWASAIWDVVRGCTPVGSDCDNCSARVYAAMHAQPGSIYEGLAEWVNPVTGEVADTVEAAGVGARPRWTGELREDPHWWVEPDRWPQGSIVAVGWLGDLFQPELVRMGLPDRLWSAMELNSHVRYVMTTRRPKEILTAMRDLGPRRMQRHIAVGVSCSGQHDLAAALNALRACPAAKRVLVVEPLLHKVVLPEAMLLDPRNRRPIVDWLLIGGEYGRKRRVTSLPNLRALLRQAKDLGIPAYVHQLGAVPIEGQYTGEILELKHPRGANIEEWPEDLRVRELPRGWTA